MKLLIYILGGMIAMEIVLFVLWVLSKYRFRRKHLIMKRKKYKKQQGEMDLELARLLFPSVMSIFMSVFCLIGGTYAWFTSTVTMSTGKFQMANYTVDTNINNAPVSFDSNTYTVEAGKPYAIQLTASGSASTGFAVITLDGKEVLCTVPFPSASNTNKTFSFTIVSDKTRQMKITGHWGSSLKESLESVSDGQKIRVKINDDGTISVSEYVENSISEVEPTVMPSQEAEPTDIPEEGEAGGTEPSSSETEPTDNFGQGETGETEPSSSETEPTGNSEQGEAEGTEPSLLEVEPTGEPAQGGVETSEISLQTIDEVESSTSETETSQEVLEEKNISNESTSENDVNSNLETEE